MQKTLLILSLVCGLSFNFMAQVTGVNYLIEYNDSTSLYDCKIVIEGGEATTYPQRIQFNSQYTIVVPTGTTLEIETLHSPKEANQFYMGTVPCLWEFGPKEFAPPTQPDLDFHTIFPNTSPPSAFDNLKEGDTITLFSVFADIDPCENSIRPFENGIDPSSLDFPNGGDFSNGFTFSGGVQTYTGNLSSNFENSIASSDSFSICNGECLVFDPTILCFEDSLFYEWSTGDSTEVIEVCPTESTNYYLLVKDSMDMILDSLTVFVAVDSLKVQLQDVEICVNEFTVATSNIPGGTWESTNIIVASIDSNTGVISSNTWGACIFRYTAPNGCTALTDLLFVIESPSVEAPEIMCVGGTANASPNTGGTWTSNDPTIVSVTSDGAIEALSAGNTTLEYDDPLFECAAIVFIEVVEDQLVTITGSDSICIGEVTALAPTSGGFWALSYSSSDIVATIDNLGLVTGVGEGEAVFSFISNAPGCGASDSDTIWILDLPVAALLGDDVLCIGDTTSISPNANATWSFSDSTVASIDINTGLIAGLASGETTITLIDTNTGCSATSDTIVVNPKPNISSEFTSLCIGNTSELFSAIGGEWVTLNPEIATLDSMTVIAISAGEAGFLFTSDSTGCVSDTLFITIHPKPSINLTGSNEICIGDTTTIEPSSEGQWQSSDPSVASIDNFGNIIGLSPGTITCTYSDSATLCTSDPSVEITVLPNPFEVVSGVSGCVGISLGIFPNPPEGFWLSDNVEVATVDSLTGEIITLSGGNAIISFTSDTTGCSSIIELEVFDNPTAIFVGSSEVCIGESTNVLPAIGGTWISNNQSIAQVNDVGNVIGISSGITTLNFIDESTGCISQPLFVTVLSASDPLCIVGTNDLESQNIQVFPNPARDFINIESESILKSISIYTLGFEKLKEDLYRNGKKNTQVSISGLNKGMYLLALETNENTYYKKIIIE